jgi:hypothetical protein
VKAQNYRASAAVETDQNRCEVFELLAANLERLAAAYERIGSSSSFIKQRTAEGGDSFCRSGTRP